MPAKARSPIRPGCSPDRAERHQVGKGGVVEPLAPADELIAKIADVRDRSAEGGQAELQKDAQKRKGVFVRPCRAKIRLCRRLLPNAEEHSDWVAALACSP